MVKLKRSETRLIDDALDMGGGYVLNFSDRTFAEFFDDEFGITIHQEKYAFNGSSKAKHMRAFYFHGGRIYSRPRLTKTLGTSRKSPELFVKNLEAGRFELSPHQPHTSEALGESAGNVRK